MSQKRVVKKLHLMSSYIFLKSPYRKTTVQKNSDKNVIVLDASKNVYGIVRKLFPKVIVNTDPVNPFKRKCNLNVNNGIFNCDIVFIINEVRENIFFDIIVNGKSKIQIIKCLEYIQVELFKSDINKYYISTVSYDAISEYYCNKIFGKLNSLERNLRKLLFNIYIVNFGVQYYQATISEELQAQIKKNIQARGNAEKKEIERLQKFFYSLDYGSLQKMLFTPSWTNIDQDEKDKFLSENKDLSKLSDEELREKFLQFTPKSDWERFFNEKIKIDDIGKLIKDIGLFRNKVAHFKFFDKQDYDACNKAVVHFNKAILNAIEITESKDFTEKNTVHLKAVLKDFVNTMEKLQKMIMKSYEPMVKNISEVMNSSLEKTNAIRESVRRTQALFETIKPTIQTSLLHNVNCVSKVAMDQTNMLQFGLPWLNIQNNNIDFSEDILYEENDVDENKVLSENEEEDDI